MDEVSISMSSGDVVFKKTFKIEKGVSLHRIYPTLTALMKSYLNDTLLPKYQALIKDTESKRVIGEFPMFGVYFHDNSHNKSLQVVYPYHPQPFITSSDCISSANCTLKLEVDSNTNYYDFLVSGNTFTGGGQKLTKSEILGLQNFNFVQYHKAKNNGHFYQIRPSSDAIVQPTRIDRAMQYSAELHDIDSKTTYSLPSKYCMFNDDNQIMVCKTDTCNIVRDYHDMAKDYHYITLIKTQSGYQWYFSDQIGTRINDIDVTFSLDEINIDRTLLKQMELEQTLNRLATKQDILEAQLSDYEEEDNKLLTEIEEVSLSTKTTVGLTDSEAEIVAEKLLEREGKLKHVIYNAQVGGRHLPELLEPVLMKDENFKSEIMNTVRRSLKTLSTEVAKEHELQTKISEALRINPGYAKGPQGIQGEKGAVGPIGAQGPKGKQGQKGDKGDKGDSGAIGPSGQKGTAGATAGEVAGVLVNQKADDLGKAVLGVKVGGRGSDKDKSKLSLELAKETELQTGVKDLLKADFTFKTSVKDLLKGDTTFKAAMKGDRGLQGNPGPAGPQGQIGLQGIKGEPGPPGPPGKKGDKGDKGQDGAAGVQGPPGEKGDPGVPGLKGLRGDKGDKGEVGPIGSPGPEGKQGPIGPPGEKGDPGKDSDPSEIVHRLAHSSRFKRSLKGEDGEPGIEGLPGLDGRGADPAEVAEKLISNKTDKLVNIIRQEVIDRVTTWGASKRLVDSLTYDDVLRIIEGKADTGRHKLFEHLLSNADLQDPSKAKTFIGNEVAGNADLQNAVADALRNDPGNARGPRGKAGEKGKKGEDGPEGPQGIQGERGEDGPEGPQGIQGERGEDGPEGPQGIQGERGEDGPEGPQGIQGERGEDGSEGPQGIQGERGVNGSEGPQGLRGEKGEIGVPGLPGERGPAGRDAVNSFALDSQLQKSIEDLQKKPALKIVPGDTNENIQEANIELEGVGVIATFLEIGYFFKGNNLYIRNHITGKSILVPQDFHFLKVVEDGLDNYKLAFCNYLGNLFFDYKKYNSEYAGVLEEYKTIDLRYIKNAANIDLSKYYYHHMHSPLFAVKQGEFEAQSTENRSADVYEIVKDKKIGTLVDEFGFFEHERFYYVNHHQGYDHHSQELNVTIEDHEGNFQIGDNIIHPIILHNGRLDLLDYLGYQNEFM